MSTPRKRPAKKAAAKKTAPKRTGRPLRLGERIGERASGEPITIAEQIIEATAAGNYVETAAAAAGIDKTTLYDWMRRGARLNADDGEGRRSRFTADERALMSFSHAVARAIAQSEARDVTNLARLAAGGMPVVVETIKVNDKGEQIEKTTRTAHTLPEAGVLEWRLERRFRDRWGRQVEVTGAGGGPLALDLGETARETLDRELAKIAERLDGARVPDPSTPGRASAATLDPEAAPPE